MKVVVRAIVGVEVRVVVGSVVDIVPISKYLVSDKRKSIEVERGQNGEVSEDGRGERQALMARTILCDLHDNSNERLAQT